MTERKKISTRKPELDRATRAKQFAAGDPRGRRPPSGQVRLTVNIDAGLHRKFKSRAALDGETMGAMLERWIREHLEV